MCGFVCGTQYTEETFVSFLLKDFLNIPPRLKVLSLHYSLISLLAMFLPTRISSKSLELLTKYPFPFYHRYLLLPHPILHIVLFLINY